MLLLALLLASRIVPPTANVEYRQPQMAAGAGVVGLAFGAGDRIYYAESRDAGLFFADPVALPEAGKLALGRHRGPRIAIAGRAVVISAVVGAKGGGADGDLLTWRSTDHGRTWSAPVAVNDVTGAAREGLHAMAARGDTVFAVWLDLRSKGTRLYGAVSSDAGRTWSKNTLIYESPAGHICECCHPSLAFGPDGEIYAMWRNWLGGSRDLYYAVSTNGGHSFQEAEKLGAGTWPLQACPMDGGGIAVSPSGQVITAWRRDSSIYLAPAGGRETEVGTGKDPAVALSPDGAYAIWTAPGGLFARLPGKSEPVRVSFRGAFPNLLAVPGGFVLAAWEEEGAIVIRSLQ